MMKAIKVASLIMLMGVAWIPSVSSAPILFEDFESVTPGPDVMPTGWINSWENTVASGTGESGTAAATQGSMLPNQFGYTRGPNIGGSNSVTGFGIENPFTVADSLSCTYRYWSALSEGITGSWADSAAENITLGGGPFHLAGTVQLAQCNDGTPPADGPACAAGGNTGPNQNCYLFRAVANIRYWSIGGGASPANTGAGLNCDGEPWTPSTNKLSQAIHMAVATAQDYDNSLQIKVTLETGGTNTGKKMEWRQGFAGALSGAGEPDDIGTSACALATDTQVAFSTYATGMAIDDVIIEDTNNIIPVELSGYSID